MSHVKSFEEMNPEQQFAYLVGQRSRDEQFEEVRAECERLSKRADDERKARKAAESVNAEEVLRHRTNLEAQIASEKARADDAEAECERLRGIAEDMLSVTREITDAESKLEDIALDLDAWDKRMGRVGHTQMQEDLRRWAEELRAALSPVKTPEEKG